jgi:hypothetical protein
MTRTKKIALILIIIGICLPTATLPFITEFKPVPELCLTSNFFKNMGNMIVVLGADSMDRATGNAAALSAPAAIPYRYLFSLGVVLVCTGLGTLIVTAGSGGSKKD